MAKDSKTKMIMAKVAPSKGVENYAVEVVEKMVEQLGYRKAILRSHSEPAILVLKEAIRGESDAEIWVERVPVGDHQANRLVANANKNAQCHFRVMKDAWERRHGRRGDA